MMQKKQYTTAFKAQVVQEALREDKTLSQLGAVHGVHPTVIADWKALALKGLPSLFENGHSELGAEKAAHEKQVNELYAEIGKLTTQLAWLKKKAGIRDE
jgi:transposase-like protein